MADYNQLLSTRTLIANNRNIPADQKQKQIAAIDAQIARARQDNENSRLANQRANKRKQLAEQEEARQEATRRQAQLKEQEIIRNSGFWSKDTRQAWNRKNSTTPVPSANQNKVITQSQRANEWNNNNIPKKNMYSMDSGVGSKLNEKGAVGRRARLQAEKTNAQAAAQYEKMHGGFNGTIQGSAASRRERTQTRNKAVSQINNSSLSPTEKAKAIKAIDKNMGYSTSPYRTKSTSVGTSSTRGNISKKGKRSPTAPNGTGKSGKKGTSATAKNSKKVKTTVWNSSKDNQLKVKDTYGPLTDTINSFYKFTNTMNFKDLTTTLKGGLNGLNAIAGYLKKTREFVDKFKGGITPANLLDTVKAISPAAKAALAGTNITPKMVDQFVGGIEVGIKMKDTYKKIRHGEIDKLTGINDLAKALTGHDLAIVKDIRAMKAAVGGIITEFSKSGIAIKDEWKKLMASMRGEAVGGFGDVHKVTDDDYSENHLMALSAEMAQAVLPELTKNGDYGTINAALSSLNPHRIEQISGPILTDMLKNFSFNSVFNVGRDKKELYKEMMDLIYKFKGGDVLWVDRGEGKRKAFNQKIFMEASSDFKELMKINLATPYYYTPETKVSHLDYGDKGNEVFMLLNNLYQSEGSFKESLTKDFPDFILPENKLVNPIVEPMSFKADITYL